MPNPFPREQDAFKMLVAFMVGAAIVIAVTLITGSSVAGVIVAIRADRVRGRQAWVDSAAGRRSGTARAPTVEQG